MAQQNNGSVVSRVMQALGKKPAPVAVAAPVATAPVAAAQAEAPKLTSDQMYNAITGGGRCLPG